MLHAPADRFDDGRMLAWTHDDRRVHGIGRTSAERRTDLLCHADDRAQGGVGGHSEQHVATMKNGKGHLLRILPRMKISAGPALVVATV
jgi:hypothetical protein